MNAQNGLRSSVATTSRRRPVEAIEKRARNVSRIATTTRAEQNLDERNSSWRERAINAEAHAKKLKSDLAERDSRIADLTGQLYDPNGVHLVDENARLRGLLAVTNQNLKDAHIEMQTLTRSLDAARANVKRERQRNVTQLFSADHTDRQRFQHD